MDKTKYKKLTRELMIGLRGSLSQGELGRKLDVEGDQIYRWESGHAAIRWQDFVLLARAAKAPLESVAQRYFGFRGDLIQTTDFFSHLVRERSLTEIAKLLEVSRPVVSKWKSGSAEPTLEQMLRLLNSSRYSLPLVLAEIVDPSLLPSLAAELKRLRAEKDLCFRFPWMPAFIQTLLTQNYLSVPHRDGAIASAIGVSVAEEKEMLAALIEAGSIHWNGANYMLIEGHRNFSVDFEGNRRLREYWTRRCLSYIETAKGSTEGVQWGCAFLDVSEKAYAQLSHAYMTFLQQLNTIVTEDKDPRDRVILLNTQIVDVRRLPREASVQGLKQDQLSI